MAIYMFLGSNYKKMNRKRREIWKYFLKIIEESLKIYFRNHLKNASTVRLFICFWGIIISRWIDKKEKSGNIFFLNY